MIARLAALALAVAAAGPAGAACREDLAEFRWPGGGARFSVEIADDAAERARGLMYRAELGRSAGMLFVYDRPAPASFWMKNTLIPLDLVFIDETGTVTHVHPEAVPHDTTPIPGRGPVLMVLEINGGLAARIGLAEGAELRHPRLDPGLAAWPCPAP